MPRRPATPRRAARRTDPATDARGDARPDPIDPIDPIAEPLHRGALRLLRLLRREDAATSLSAARLSALSVLVFGGPCALGALATAEQVSAPTITRLVQELEREGWVRRGTLPDDARSALVAATPAAVRLLGRGRDRRLGALSRGLAVLSSAEREAIAAAVGPLLRLVDALGAPGEDATAGPRNARSGRRRFD